MAKVKKKIKIVKGKELVCIQDVFISIVSPPRIFKKGNTYKLSGEEYIRLSKLCQFVEVDSEQARICLEAKYMEESLKKTKLEQRKKQVEETWEQEEEKTRKAKAKLAEDIERTKEIVEGMEKEFTQRFNEKYAPKR